LHSYCKYGWLAHAIKPNLIVAVSRTVYKFLKKNLPQEYGGKLYKEPIPHYSTIKWSKNRKKIIEAKPEEIKNMLIELKSQPSYSENTETVI